MRCSPSQLLRIVALGATCALFVPAAQSAGADEPSAPAAAPTIYKWVDANGVAHYTTDLSRVPRSVRGSVRTLGGGSSSGQEGYAARDAGQSAPPEATPAEPPPEWDVGEAPSAAQPGQGEPSAAAATPPPAPAPAPRAQGTDRWAETDRPSGLGGDQTPPPEGAPTQTAAAQADAGSAGASAADRAGQRQDLDARIAALQTDIAADEETLKTFLAAQTAPEPGEVASDPSFREVAERLPKRLAELRGLESERAQLGAD